MATIDMLCPECNTKATFEGHLPFREECEKCSSDLHICRTCRFYDRFAADECRESSADPVANKDRRNLCEYWKPISTEGDATPSVDDAKKKLFALFRSDAESRAANASGEGAAESAPSADAPANNAGEKKSETDVAKEKLNALFPEKKD